MKVGVVCWALDWAGGYMTVGRLGGVPARRIREWIRFQDVGGSGHRRFRGPFSPGPVTPKADREARGFDVELVEYGRVEDADDVVNVVGSQHHVRPSLDCFAAPLRKEITCWNGFSLGSAAGTAGRPAQTVSGLL